MAASRSPSPAAAAWRLDSRTGGGAAIGVGGLPFCCCWHFCGTILTPDEVVNSFIGVKFEDVLALERDPFARFMWESKELCEVA